MVVEKLDIKLDKDKIFDAFRLDKNNYLYSEIEKSYLSLEKEFYKRINPIGIFDKFHQEVYCLLTLGKEITNFYDKIFQEGRYTESLLVDYMCDDYIFQMDKKICDLIMENIKPFKVNKRMEPFVDCEPYLQKTIAEKLEAEDFEISVNECFVFSPIKTKSFILKNEECDGCSIFHECKNCSNIECTWRNE